MDGSPFSMHDIEVNTLGVFSVHVIVVHHEFSPLSHSVVGLLHEEYTKSHTDAERSHPGALPFTYSGTFPEDT